MKTTSTIQTGDEMKQEYTKTEIKTMQQELLRLLLKRAGIPITEIYDDAKRYFVASNIDLLTAAEKQKYKGVIL
jgi:hypothetical protein